MESFLKYKNKLMEKEIRFMVTRCRGWGEGESETGGQKVQTPDCKTVRSRDGMYDMMTTEGTLLDDVHPKSSHHKERFFFPFILLSLLLTYISTPTDGLS